jgi:hypothetical protein
LLGLTALSRKVPHLPAVVAGKVTSGKLLRWPNGSLLQWWGRSTVELLLMLLLLELPLLELWAIAPVLLLLQLAQLAPKWGVHHAVLRRSTARTTTASGSRHHFLSLFLIGLSNGLHHSLLINSCTCQFIVRQTGELYQTLLQVDGEFCTIQVGLLLIRVDVV